MVKMVKDRHDDLSVQFTDRSREIFQRIVDSYLETGAPIGSRSLARTLPERLSPASVRNVMSDLEELGLIYAPHTSAGRMPTHHGLRLFVDGLLQVGDISAEERLQIRRQLPEKEASGNMEHLLARASEMLSGLSRCAGLVLSKKQIKNIRYLEFVYLEPGKALVVIVSNDNIVENRLLDIPDEITASDLVGATNYLRKFLENHTLEEAVKHIEDEMETIRQELDTLTASVLQSGLGSWADAEEEGQTLIVRGQANLLENINAEEQLGRIRQLFEDLENKKEVIDLLCQSDEAEGVRIFIGAENDLFSLSGSSVIVSPFRNSQNHIVGVLGVIGPTRVNYARIIPMVDYTARLVGRLIS